jgi:hypothetical protein
MATDPPDEAKKGATEAEAKGQVQDQTEISGQDGNRIAVAPPLRAAGAPPPPIPPPTVPITPATTRQKITLAILLAIFSVAIIGAWFYVLDQAEDQLHREYKLSWEAPSNLELRPGPPTFYYDRQTHEMRQRGPIDTKLKSELIALPIAKENQNADAAIQSYNDAINSLAYKSNESLRGILILLLLFGGLSGLLGNQLRTNMNFVNIIVYKDALDVHRWWPWYAIPPFISFVLGVVVVLMIKAELISLGDKVPSGSLGWAGLAFLAGFGASDFTERLRLLTQTLFGKSST